MPYERNNPIRQFERTIAKHCGSKYGVAVESCSAALFLSFLFIKNHFKDCFLKWPVEVPKKTYFSVPMSIRHVGGEVRFVDKKWRGAYRFGLYPVIDSAMRFKKGMYQKNTFMCLSFHYAKHIPIGRGGMILTDNKKAADWFRIMRADGRREIPKEKDKVKLWGWNFYMTAEQAARGLELFYWRIHGKPDLADLPMTHGDVSYV